MTRHYHCPDVEEPFGGRPRVHTTRQILDAILFYVLKSTIPIKSRLART